MSTWHTDPKAFRRLFELVEKSLQGTLNTAEHNELDHLLRTDHQAAEVYLQIVDESCILRSWAQGGLQLVEAATQSETCDEPSAVPSRSVRPWGTPIARAIDWHRHPVRFLATISVLTLMFLSVLAIWIWPRQAHHQQATQPSPAFTGRPAALAKVIGTHQAKEEPDSAPTFAGAHLRSGQTIRLKSGLVEIRFKSGATALLEGPGQLRFDGRNAGYLKLGKLVAQVRTPAAQGFTIETPGVKIVDLGTEFCAKVDRQGETEVAVLEGTVQASLLAANRQVAKTMRLTAGETAGFLPATATRPASVVDRQHSPAQFTRSLPRLRSIGINFAQKPADQLFVANHAGVVLGNHWNNLQAAATGGNTSVISPASDRLVDSQGNATDATITWQAADGYSYGTAKTGKPGVDRMLSGCLIGDNTISEITISVSNIPYPRYDVYVFVSIGNRTGSLRLGDQAMFYQHSVRSRLIPASSVTPPGTEGGNYVVFQNLSTPSFTLRTDGSLVHVASNSVHGIHLVERLKTSEEKPPP